MGVRSGKGDNGFTDLLFHKHVSKDSPYIGAIGDLDEVSCYLGLIKSKMRSRKDVTVIERIQRAISAISTEISVGTERKSRLGLLLRKEDVDWAESVVYELEGKVKIETCFDLPGYGEVSSLLDIARTVTRRAERNVVGLFRKHKVKNDNILSYLNCASDILFLMAREKAQGEKKPRVKRRAKAGRAKVRRKGKR